MDVDEADVARPTGDEIDQRNVVDRRLGIGESRHRGDAAGRRGMARRDHVLHVLGAGLAQLHAHVDDSRGQTMPTAIDHGRPAWRPAAAIERRDQAVDDEDAAGLIAPARRVEQPRVAEEGRAHGIAGPLPRSRVNSSRQAMRTATPISTWWRMTLRSMSSATSLSVSTPRFICPGCIIIASGLATASLS